MDDEEWSERTLFAITIVMTMCDLVVEPDWDVGRLPVVFVRLVIRDIFLERSLVLFSERISGDLNLLAGCGVSASVLS